MADRKPLVLAVGRTKELPSGDNLVVGALNGLTVSHDGAGTLLIEEPTDLHLLTMTDTTTLNGGTHSGVNTGDQTFIVNGLRFIIDTGSTADSDPGNGLLKFNHATQASATFIYVDDLTNDGVSLTPLWAAMLTGGLLLLQSATAQGTWQLWVVSSFTDASGYAKFGVTLMAAGGSFADGEPVFVTIGQGSSGGSGHLLQPPTIVTSTTSASVTSTTLPGDNTIPQNTEGTAYTAIDPSITPTSASSILLVGFYFPYVSASGVVDVRIAAFRDSGVGAVFAKQATAGGSNHTRDTLLLFMVPSGSTSATTFTLRVGVSGGTAYLNKISTGDLFGGVGIAVSFIMEFSP